MLFTATKDDCSLQPLSLADVGIHHIDTDSFPGSSKISIELKSNSADEQEGSADVVDNCQKASANDLVTEDNSIASELCHDFVSMSLPISVYCWTVTGGNYGWNNFDGIITRPFHMH